MSAKSPPKPRERPTAGWALHRLCGALYGARHIQRLFGFAPLQKRPPEGAVGRSRGGAPRRALFRAGGDGWRETPPGSSGVGEVIKMVVVRMQVGSVVRWQLDYRSFKRQTHSAQKKFYLTPMPAPSLTSTKERLVSHSGIFVSSSRSIKLSEFPSSCCFLSSSISQEAR